MKVQIVIHGGCGASLTVESIGKARLNEAENLLKASLKKGHQILLNGGSALDAVVAAIKIMEDSPIFNAGKGAVFTSEETNECDAGIMDGKSGLAGGASTLKSIKNPICLATEIMLKTPHPLLCGEGAEKFGKSCAGIEMVNPKYFFTEGRLSALRNHKKAPEAPTKLDFDDKDDNSVSQEGTVGAVALDVNGNLAGGSSTGGMTGKLPGRVSDSAVVGAGFYANWKIAVSATGNGDYFLRHSTGRRIADLVELKGISLSEACAEVIWKDLKHSSAGVIGLDSEGNVAMPFNTSGMFRGTIGENGEPWVRTFK